MDITKLSEKDYRAYERESYSSIKYLLESPKVFLHYKEKPFRGSTSSLLGTCIHHYLQGNKHLVAFNTLAKTKKNREAIKELEDGFMTSTNGEGIIVPASFEEKLNCIMKNYNETPKITHYLKDCEFEQAFLFSINGVDLKGKIDGVCKVGKYIIEIKSSSQATNIDQFREEASDRDYDLQAYMYLKATGFKTHYFLVVNTTEPFKLDIYRSSAKFLESGKHKADIVTERYKKYIIGSEVWNESNEIEEV